MDENTRRIAEHRKNFLNRVASRETTPETYRMQTNLQRVVDRHGQEFPEDIEKALDKKYSVWHLISMAISFMHVTELGGDEPSTEVDTYFDELLETALQDTL